MASDNWTSQAQNKVNQWLSEISVRVEGKILPTLLGTKYRNFSCFFFPCQGNSQSWHCSEVPWFPTSQSPMYHFHARCYMPSLWTLPWAPSIQSERPKPRSSSRCQIWVRLFWWQWCFKLWWGRCLTQRAPGFNIHMRFGNHKPVSWLVTPEVSARIPVSSDTLCSLCFF